MSEREHRRRRAESCYDGGMAQEDAVRAESRALERAVKCGGRVQHPLQQRGCESSAVVGAVLQYADTRYVERISVVRAAVADGDVRAKL